MIPIIILFVYLKIDVQVNKFLSKLNLHLKVNHWEKIF